MREWYERNGRNCRHRIALTAHGPLPPQSSSFPPHGFLKRGTRMLRDEVEPQPAMGSGGGAALGHQTRGVDRNRPTCLLPSTVSAAANDLAGPEGLPRGSDVVDFAASWWSGAIRAGRCLAASSYGCWTIVKRNGSRRSSAAIHSAVCAPGHQLGYRSVPNSYDAWDVWTNGGGIIATWSPSGQRDRARAPETDANRDSPHFPLRRSR